MLDIATDVLDMLGAPKLVLPFTLVGFVAFSQAMLMDMKNKDTKDTIWILKWTDDICFVNLQWLFSLLIVLIWVPIVYWGDFLLDRWVLHNRILGLILSLGFVYFASFYFINMLRERAIKRYLVDCQVKNITQKWINLFDIVCFFVFIVGAAMTTFCFIYNLEWSMFLDKYHPIAWVCYWTWQIYFAFTGVGMKIERIRTFILKFGFIKRKEIQE